MLLNVGPITTLRPRLPKWKMAAELTVATGKITTEPVGQGYRWTADHKTRLGKYWNPIPVVSGVREKVIGAPASGRMVATPVKPVFTGAPARRVHRVTALCLHNRGKLPAINESILVEGQLVETAEHKPVTYVEV